MQLGELITPTYMCSHNVTSYFYHRNLTCENRQGLEDLLRTPLPLYPISLYRHGYNATSVKDRRVGNLHHEIFHRIRGRIRANPVSFDNTMLRVQKSQCSGYQPNRFQSIRCIFFGCRSPWVKTVLWLLRVRLTISRNKRM